MYKFVINNINCVLFALVNLITSISVEGGEGRGEKQCRLVLIFFFRKAVKFVS